MSTTTPGADPAAAVADIIIAHRRATADWWTGATTPRWQPSADEAPLYDARDGRFIGDEVSPSYVPRPVASVDVLPLRGLRDRAELVAAVRRHMVMS